MGSRYLVAIIKMPFLSWSKGAICRYGVSLGWPLGVKVLFFENGAGRLQL